MFNNRVKLVAFAICVLFMFALFAGCKKTKSVYDAASDYIKVSHDENANYDSPFNTDDDTVSEVVKGNTSKEIKTTDKTGSDSAPASSSEQQGTTQQPATTPSQNDTDNSTEVTPGQIVGEIDDNSGDSNFGPVVAF